MSLITFHARIHFADRVLEDALSEELARLAIRRPFILRQTGDAQDDAAERLAAALPLAARPVSFATSDNGTATADLTEAAALFARSACDGIVGFGGAQALDLARLLGRSGAPVIAIPTGTESVGLGPIGVEFAGHAGRQPPVPAAILCDATLTLSAEPAATAAAGMDALVHCLEAYLSTAYNPPADGIALDGLRRAVRSLPAAVRDGRDLEARRDLLVAALNGGLAAQKGLGGIEAAARGLEPETRVRHGALHAAILPQVLEFNAPAVADRMGAIRTALGLGAGADVAATLCDLAEQVGLPVRLSDVGIPASVLPRAALRAEAHPANRTNPRHATSRDYRRIMNAALRGDGRPEKKLLRGIESPLTLRQGRRGRTLDHNMPHASGGDDE